MDVIDTAQVIEGNIVDDAEDGVRARSNSEFERVHHHMDTKEGFKRALFISVISICIGLSVLSFPVSVPPTMLCNNFEHKVNAEPAPTEHTLPIKFVVLAGKSQTGKSEFRNSIDKDKVNVAEVGNGNGISVTTKPTVYSMRFDADPDYNIPVDFKLYLMDTRGLGDVRGNLTDEDTLEEIVYVLSQMPEAVQLDAIFLTESLSHDVIQLVTARGDGNLNKLTFLFGDSVTRSIAVLGTKPLQSVTNHGSDIREKTVRKLCKDYDIEYMSYESRKDWDYKNQFRNLMALLFGDSALEPYNLEGVNQVKEWIATRAQQMMRDTPKKTQSFKDIETYQDGTRCSTDIRVGFHIRAGCGIPVIKKREVTKTIEIDHDVDEFMRKATEEYKELHKIDVDFQSQTARIFNSKV
eukprot:615327_1